MDGTLLDSEKIWEQGSVILAGEHFNKELENQLNGAGVPRCGQLLHEYAQVGSTPEEASEILMQKVLQLLNAGPVAFMPGAEKLLYEFAAQEYPQVLVTASPHEFTAPLKQLVKPGVLKRLIAAEDTPKTKPNPAPYILAAQTLGKDPLDLLALEDSPTGVAAAIGAGIPVICLGANAEKQTLIKQEISKNSSRVYFLENLTAQTPDSLAAIWREIRQ
ncbi:HAD family phosphatase [Actinomycetaceae bacterium TAE3-ERU4]|nr:HAD family phosphatase [Actinomycetaceae bacterium TAE3-ERU4]